MIDYSPFFKTLKRKGISQYRLIHFEGVSTGTLDALRNNRSVTVHTLQQMIDILHCEVQDIVRITPDTQESSSMKETK